MARRYLVSALVSLGVVITGPDVVLWPASRPAASAAIEPARPALAVPLPAELVPVAAPVPVRPSRPAMFTPLPVPMVRARRLSSH